MNTNLLKIVKQIIADYGEEPFTNPKRLKALFSDLAKDEPKPLRTAFGRCIEASAYNALKSAKDAAERVARKATIAQRVRDEHGLDPILCAEALDILEAALFGTASPVPKTTPVPQAAPSVKPHITYRLSVNMQESGPFSMEQLLAMAHTKQLTEEFWYLSSDSTEWKPITGLISTLSVASQAALCPSCGAKLPGGFRFCPSCGAAVVPGTTQKIWRELQTLKRHTGDVFSVVYSPDGSRIVSGSNDKTIKIWDAGSGRELQTLKGHTDWVNSVAYSPDGSRIVSGSWDKTIKIWDAGSGRELQTLKGHWDSVSVAYSPDGSRIVSGSFDYTIKIWDARSGHELQTLKGHTNRVESVAYSPDGSRIVSGSWDNTIKIWDAGSGYVLQTLKGHTREVLSVAYSPDGRRIVSGAADNTIKIWDAGSGYVLQSLEGHGEVLSVAYSPDGSRIVSGSNDNTIKIWGAD